MCGIAGLLTPHLDGRSIVSAMLDAEAHRGPDGSGIWSEPIGGRHLHLGHRRLSIIDLSTAGSQPMVDVSRNLVVTFNGEIYNYLEIRRELISTGVQFQSHSDTEVILEAYRRWGTACLSRFNGMFAFALYDRREAKLFCARDRFGEKPFLYSLGRDFFTFGSEYKALLLNPALSLDIDETRLVRAAYKQGAGLDNERQTVFDSIQQLLPGEAMEVDLRTLRAKTWRYWQIDPMAPTQHRDEADAFAEFRELLTDAVRLRLRSDVTVGSCLSGGLDSSAIVGIARGLLGADAPYHTFTGRFPGTASDEWTYASDVIDRNHTIPHTVEPTVERFVEDLPEFLWHNELPVGSSSQFAQWCVFRLAKEQGITVLLDGQGADETLGGYEQYFAFYVESLRESGQSERLERELPLIRERYPLALARKKRALQDRLPFRARHWLSNRFNFGSNVLYGVKPDIAAQAVKSAVRDDHRGMTPLANALRHDSFNSFLTVLLRYGDRNSMAHSREVRLPFCDHRIAEFVFSLEPHLLMGEVQTKRLLRESMRGILPESIRARWNKQGFLPPQDAWFRSPKFLAMVREMLGRAGGSGNGPWIQSWLDNAADRMENGQRQLASPLWQPFINEAWREFFLERVSRQRQASAKLACART
jgi:asparagine synthase (glutamine-hydrolysing)